MLCRMRCFRPGPVAVLAPLLLLPIGTARATSLNRATIYLGYSDSIVGTVFTDGEQETSGASVAVSSDGYSSPMGATTQHAEAAAGAVRAQSFSTTEGGYAAYFTGSAIASWEEMVEVTAPGRSGPGVMQVAIEITGSLNCVLYEIDYNKSMGGVSNVYADVITSTAGKVFSAQASMLLSPSAGPEPEIKLETLYGYVYDDLEVGEFSRSFASISGSYVFDVPFVFGEPFLLTGILEAATGTQGGRGGTPGTTLESLSAFGGSMVWRGVVGVRTGGGAVVTDFQLTSESGFDYVTAVPEPAAAWPAVAALLALGSRASRRATRAVRASAGAASG